MIRINLLPEALKPLKSAALFNAKQILFILPAIFVILIILHFYVILQSVSINKKYSAVNKEWKDIAPQIEALKIGKEKKPSSGGTISFAQAVKSRIAWAQKLSLISVNLPQGVWLNELAVNNKSFTLKGSVISLDKDELGLVKDFLNNLEQDKNFLKDFVNLEMGPAQRETVHTMERVDFTFSGQLK